MENLPTIWNGDLDLRKVQVGKVIASSIDTSTVEGKRRQFRALIRSDFKVADMKGDILRIKDVVLWGDELEDQVTGEVTNIVRTTLITDDEQRILAASDGIAKTVIALARQFGPPPWAPPMQVRIEEINTANGRRYYILEPV